MDDWQGVLFGSGWLRGLFWEEVEWESSLKEG